MPVSLIGNWKEIIIQENYENTNEKNLVDMDVTSSAPMLSYEDKLKVNKEFGSKKIIGSYLTNLKNQNNWKEINV